MTHKVNRVNDKMQIEKLTSKKLYELSYQCCRMQRYASQLQDNCHHKQERKLLFWSAIAGIVAALVGL